MITAQRIVTIGPKLLAGRKLEMSFARNRTFELWTTFMPKRRHFRHVVNEHLYSLQVYPPGFFQPFDPARLFTKWALVEVSEADALPEGMELFALPGGLYAVFDFRGSSAEAQRTFQYIYGDWLAASGYVLDERPHFEVLGTKYRRDDPSSEEEIWIPLRAGTRTL